MIYDKDASTEFHYDKTTSEHCLGGT